MDDFAWLGLHTQVHDFPSFLSSLFRPMAQGTVRPLSERLFFLSFWHLFGMEALPYRILVFLTQFANLTLISILVWRLTASRAASFLAPMLWLASPVLYLPMTWTSAYNQILSTFFLLSQTLLLLVWLETGKTRYYAGMWLAFLAGFGALELNIVFPGIALLYVLLFARGRIAPVLPLFVVSAAYALWHRHITSPMRSSTYALAFRPGDLLATLREYIQLSVTAVNLPRLELLSDGVANACAVVTLIGLGAFVALRLARRCWLVLFFLGWFVITLAPYIPLTAHVSDYYLTAPTVGLAMLGGWGLATAWKSGFPAKLAAVLALLCFALPCAWQAWEMSRWYSAKSRRVRSVLRGVATARAHNPGKGLLLAGVDDDVFWHGLYDQPEHALGWPMLYLTQETQNMLTKREERENFSNRFLPDALALQGIRNGSIVVYDVSRTPLRNATAAYRSMLAAEPEVALPSLVDLGNPLYSPFVGQGWFDIDHGLRWMSRRGELKISAPKQAGSKLRVSGHVSHLHTGERALRVKISVDGIQIAEQEIPRGGLTFDWTLPLPPESFGKKEMLIALETDRTVSAPQDERAVGLLMGAVEVVR